MLTTTFNFKTGLLESSMSKGVLLLSLDLGLPIYRVNGLGQIIVF